MSRYNLSSCSISAPIGACIAYSALWYVRFQIQGGCPSGMTEEVPFASDPAWLTLPIMRRELALRRRKAMLEYEENAEPGDAEAQRAADKMGLTVGQFYRLRRQWNRERSIFSLIPYGRRGVARKPKLDSEVSDAVSRLVTTAVAVDGVRTPAEILRKIRREWSLDKPIPSHMTLRNRISDALAALEGVSGNIVLNNADLPQELIESATSYGEAVAIDHAPIDLFLALEAGPSPALLTLVIDLFSTSICGFHVSSSAPGPTQVLEALRDAESRSHRESRPQTAAIKPRLVFACSHAPAWRPLLDEVARLEIEASVRKTRTLHTGGMVARLIGREIHSVKLSPRKRVGELIFNPERDALVSLKELQNLLEASVSKFNSKRISPGTTRRPLKLDL